MQLRRRLFSYTIMIESIKRIFIKGQTLELLLLTKEQWMRHNLVVSSVPAIPKLYNIAIFLNANDSILFNNTKKFHYIPILIRSVLICAQI